MASLSVSFPMPSLHFLHDALLLLAYSALKPKSCASIFANEPTKIKSRECLRHGHGRYPNITLEYSRCSC